MMSQLEPAATVPATSLRESFRTQLKALKELFSDWKEDDFLAVLTELNGDLDLTISRISEGTLCSNIKVMLISGTK